MSPNLDERRRIITNFQTMLIVGKKQFPTHFLIFRNVEPLTDNASIGLNKYYDNPVLCSLGMILQVYHLVNFSFLTRGQ